MNRKLCLITPEMSELLIKQLAHELKNYSLYKSFANFFGINGIFKLEQYWNLRAEEEKHHSEWIHDYLTEADVKFTYPATEVNNEKFSDYEKPFILALDREIETTQLIYKICDLASSTGDYMTLQWLYSLLVKEQVEEENNTRAALTIIVSDGNIYSKAKEILRTIVTQ